MGKDAKLKLKPNSLPGPGSYEAKIKPSAPAFVMPGRYNAKKVEPAPGPGQYSNERKERQPTAVKMLARGVRPSTAAASSSFSTIGPGSYDLRGTMGRVGGRFSKAERKDTVTKSATIQNPGPGAYQQATDKVTTKTPSFSYILVK